MDLNEYFNSLCQLSEGIEGEIEYDKKRDTCAGCERPIPVCLCEYIPKNLTISPLIKIWIFQHPFEIKRCLRTTLILEKCLSTTNFEIVRSKRFSIERFPQLKEVYENEHTYVLYPSPQAILLDDLPDIIKEINIKNENNNANLIEKIHIIVVDGTWSQASGIFYTNQELKKLKQIKIVGDFISAYKIRTQPRECFLSTLETVALILSKLENKPNLYGDLVRPLEALCNYQFDHGAQTHSSKEYLIMTGQYKKPISKKNLSKITKDTKLVPQNKEEISETKDQFK